MTELRLHRDLYLGPSIDEAVKTFERFGSFELLEEKQHWVVKISCKTEARERQIFKELANFALGLTVKERKAS
jgi:hypothetical protein